MPAPSPSSLSIKTLALASASALLLAACASVPSVEVRRQHAAELAASQGWQTLQLDTKPFRLRAFAPAEAGQHELLTLYLEGDGFAWINSRRPSPDPTPLDPLALRLALADSYRRWDRPLQADPALTRALRQREARQAADAVP